MKTRNRRNRTQKNQKIYYESLQCRGFKCKLSNSLRKEYSHKPRKGNIMSRKGGGWPWSKRKKKMELARKITKLGNSLDNKLVRKKRKVGLRNETLLIII